MFCEDILQPSPKIDHFLNYRKNSKYVCTKYIPPKHYRNIFFLKTSFNIFSVLNQAEILQDRFVPLSKYWKKELLFTESSILKISTKNMQLLQQQNPKNHKLYHLLELIISEFNVCSHRFPTQKIKIFHYTFPTFIYVSKNTSFAKDPLRTLHVV